MELTCTAFDKAYRVAHLSHSTLEYILFPSYRAHSVDKPSSKLHLVVKDS